MHNKIDLNLFIVLRAVYQHGSITLAANALHLTQPAVSHALGRLRENYSDALFVRHGRKMTPTPFCQSIIASVDSAINALESTVTGNITFDIRASQRQITLGMRDILESIYLPSLMPDLIYNTPNISLYTQQVTWPQLANVLANQQVDIIIDVLMPTGSDIHSQFLCNDNFVVVCTPDNPYISSPTLHNYANAEHALVTLKDSKLDTVDLALAQHNLHRHIALQCEHYYAAVNVISQCNLLLTMPSQYAKLLKEKFDIAIAPLPFVVPDLNVYMYWHKQADDDLVNQWMRNKLIETTASLRLNS